MDARDLIGSSAEFRRLLDKVEMVAPVDSAVLIQGETGTGKEVIARAVHDASPRRRGKFVALNCAAIPGPLLESELFGCEKGAFTGSVAQTIGRFQAADGGTLFLDEIGDLPLELQPKLLRALQEKEFERLGSGRTQRVDVRVIAATNQDLDRMVHERKFRADLYYRLNVFPITIPPLRERGDDIPLLAEYFVQKFAKQQRKFIQTIPSEVMAGLRQHSWPGNIRELQNVIERGVILTSGPVLSRHTTDQMTRFGDSGDTPACHQRVAALPFKTLDDAKRAHISATLRETNWVIGGPNGAAAQLGLPRTTLISLMHRLGISGNTSRNKPQASSERSVHVMGGGYSSRLKNEASTDFEVMEAVAG